VDVAATKGANQLDTPQAATPPATAGERKRTSHGGHASSSQGLDAEIPELRGAPPTAHAQLRCPACAWLLAEVGAPVRPREQQGGAAVAGPGDDPRR